MKKNHYGSTQDQIFQNFSELKQKVSFCVYWNVFQRVFFLDVLKLFKDKIEGNPETNPLSEMKKVKTFCYRNETMNHFHISNFHLPPKTNKTKTKTNNWLKLTQISELFQMSRICIFGKEAFAWKISSSFICQDHMRYLVHNTNYSYVGCTLTNPNIKILKDKKSCKSWTKISHLLKTKHLVSHKDIR